MSKLGDLPRKRSPIAVNHKEVFWMSVIKRRYKARKLL